MVNFMSYTTHWNLAKYTHKKKRRRSELLMWIRSTYPIYWSQFCELDINYFFLLLLFQFWFKINNQIGSCARVKNKIELRIKSEYENRIKSRRFCLVDCHLLTNWYAGESTFNFDAKRSSWIQAAIVDRVVLE